MSDGVFRFDAIVFDFDGVLAESVDVKAKAFAALYEPYGKDVVDKVVAWHLSHGGVSRYDKFRHFHREFLGRELAPADEAGLAQRFSALVERAVVTSAWVPGAREFLESHHSRLPLYVASGTPEQELVRIIEARGMKHYFAGVGGAPRCKGELLSTFVERCGTVSARVLMVGDSMTDYDGALEVGASFLGIAPPSAGLFPAGVPVSPDLLALDAFITPSEPDRSQAAR